MTGNEIPALINDTARLLLEARFVVAFTGAGISTLSGIPDFRSAHGGLWNKDDPMRVASATAFHNHPERFYNWLRPLLRVSHSAKPNPAHKALAELERLHIVKAVITQNIDGLHQKAGSGEVIELHGSLETFACPHCQYQSGSNNREVSEILAGGMPRCPICVAIMKPGIVLFEEMLPVGAWNRAETLISQADILLVVGSSLQVVPASNLVDQAYRAGSKIVINNLSDTFMDEFATYLIHQDVALTLPKLLNEINSQRKNPN